MVISNIRAVRCNINENQNPNVKFYVLSKSREYQLVHLPRKYKFAKSVGVCCKCRLMHALDWLSFQEKTCVKLKI